MVEMILLNGVILYGSLESPETRDNQGECERKHMSVSESESESERERMQKREKKKKAKLRINYDGRRKLDYN